MDEAKLRKKRERNRLAATKCRQRKLEKINNLGNTRKTSQIVQLTNHLIGTFVLSISRGPSGSAAQGE